MKHSSKLVVNLASSYLRIIITAITTVIATKIALEQLGASDFGIYNLTSGVIVMMTFLSGSLSISAQRYYSYHIGKGDPTSLSNCFNSSVGIHIAIGIVCALVQLSVLPFLFRFWLNIPTSEIDVAEKIFLILIATSTLTLFFIPYTAIINAREDLSVWAIADIIANIFRLGAAYAIQYTDDKLLCYGLLMGIAQLIKIVIEFSWSRVNYKECIIDTKKLYDASIWKEMLGFVGWNTLGSVAVIARNQGIAIVLNIFWGTITNAAYGIANQVNSLVLSFATAVTAVFTPSIIQSYSKGDTSKMIRIASLSSKLSFYLSSALALPILIFLNDVMTIWLGDVPRDTEIFVALMVISFVIQQMYPGFNRIIYAVGNIKSYQIWTTVLLVSNIPLGCIAFILGFPQYSIFIILFILQVGVLILTMLVCKQTIQINIKDFFVNNSIQFIILLIFIFVPKYVITIYYNTAIQISDIIIYSLIIETIYVILWSYTNLTHEDRIVIKKMILKKYKNDP